MPNKTEMGSGGAAVSGAMGLGGMVWGRVWGTTGEAHGPSAQQPQHSQGSTLPTDKGTTEHGDDTPGDESSPVGTQERGRWDRAGPQ